MQNRVCAYLRLHNGLLRKAMRCLCFILIIFGGVVILYHVGYFAGRVFIADQFVIPTWSMAPTLIPGDRVIVDKTIIGPRIYTDFDFKDEGQELKSFRLRGLRPLQRNDIVVFNFPLNNGGITFKINFVYCKRIIGLPGDSLSIVNGHYHNNNYDGVLGVKSEQDRLEQVPDSMFAEDVRYIHYDKRTCWTIFNMDGYYIPRKGDIVHITPKEALLYKNQIEFETHKKLEFDEERVTLDGCPYESHQFTHNYYFAAGDNVCDSYDSRYWGVVPEEYIVGVAKIIS